MLHLLVLEESCLFPTVCGKQAFLEQNQYLQRVQAEGKLGSFSKGIGNVEGQVIANLLPLVFSGLKKIIFSHSIACLFI